MSTRTDSNLIVYKYELPLGGNPDSKVTMPVGAKILSLQVQFDKPQIWALVDTREKLSQIRRFHIAGTGHRNVPADGEYIGTIQLNAGVYVFHVFEV